MSVPSPSFCKRIRTFSKNYQNFVDHEQCGLSSAAHFLTCDLLEEPLEKLQSVIRRTFHKGHFSCPDYNDKARIFEKRSQVWILFCRQY